MSFGKGQAYFFLIAGAIATFCIFILRPTPVFDYDFENFFSQENDELLFYQGYRETFGNDNDYLLLALQHTPDVFDSAFLAKALALQESIERLDGVEETISILTLREPIVSPFGIRYRKVLDWSSRDGLNQSRKTLAQNDLYQGAFFNRSEDQILIQIKNRQRISKEDGDVLYAQISEILNKPGTLSFQIAGKIRAQGEFVALMQAEFAWFLGLSFILIATVLWLLFRAWWAVLVPILVLAIGIIWTLALQLWMGRPLDLMSVMLPTILAIVGLAAMIHFMTKYRSYVRGGLPKESAIQQSYTRLVMPVALTSLTTALGFSTLIFSGVPVLKYFGLFTASGVVLMLLAVILLSPGLFYLFPSFKVKKETIKIEKWASVLRFAFLGLIKHKGIVLASILLATVLSIFLASQLKINGYILDNLPKDSDLLGAFHFFDQEFGGSKPIEIHLKAGSAAADLFESEVLLEIEKIERFAASNFGMSNLVSPLSVAKILNKAQNSGSDNAFVMPSRGQLLRMRPLLGKWEEMGSFKLFTGDLTQGRISGKSPDFGSYKSGQMKKDFERFLADSVDAGLIEVRLTGTSHLIDMSHRNVSLQLAKGIGIGFLVVALAVAILFRSWLLPMIVLIPNVIPLFWVAGIMQLIGAELSLSTAIIFTVAFGIAVDDTIHFMSKLQSEHSGGKSWLYAIKRTYLETGKAITLSTIVLVSGFGILVLSQFGVTFYVGLLIGLALIFALLADLTLLPVLLFWYLGIKKQFNGRRGPRLPHLFQKSPK